MEYTCEVCHKSFQQWRKGRIPRFCSRECRIASKSDFRKCLQCHVTFRVTKISPRKFCSQTCSNRYNQQPDPQKKSVFICRWCGKEFVEWKYRHPSICSNQCRSEYGAIQPKPNLRKPENRVTKNCIVCGKSFTVHKVQDSKGRHALYCSVSCKLKSKVSAPELKCEKILQNLNIQFIHQKFIKPNFYVDFLIGNIVLQVDGEYWHGHPRFAPLDKRQVAQRKRDAAQEKYLTACGYSVLRVWESDVTEETIIKLLARS